MTTTYKDAMKNRKLDAYMGNKGCCQYCGKKIFSPVIAAGEIKKGVCMHCYAKNGGAE